MTLNETKKKLEKSLSNSRYIHSINVMEEAVKLAKYHDLPVQKVKVAALLHDCAKELKDKLGFLTIRSIKADEISILNPEILHGFVGTFIARDEYEIEDDEILDAINWHSTGRRGMSYVEKLVFIADYIEPDRTFAGVDVLRKMAYTNLDKCLLLCADTSILNVLKKGRMLHPATVDLRNEMLKILTNYNY